MKCINRSAGIALITLFTFFMYSCNNEDSITTETINFQNLYLVPNSYWNGSGNDGGLTFGSASFYNNYNIEYDYWEGFAFSNKIDMTTPGWENQYSAFLKNGGHYQNVYSISYVTGENSTITFSHDVNPVTVKITNSTWAYLSMINGDAFSKKFEQDDWFKLTIKGYDGNEQEKGIIDFYLADYRNTPHYIINEWTDVDLSSLKNVKKIVFNLSSTDNGDWGMNTPAYFCMDDLMVEYEK